MSADHRSDVVDQVTSPTWDQPSTPRVAVHVPCYQRPEFLPELFAALDAQRVGTDDYEVVVVDDASGDTTWDVLSDLVRRSSMRATGLRVGRNAGPAAARNIAVAASRAPILAFTDDDCLPDPGWLSGVLDAIAPGVSVVQGRVAPPPATWNVAGPWDHAIWVAEPSPFFQTCNVAYPRDRFEAAGGFDDSDPLLRPGEGRHFGEDAVLGWHVLQLGGDRVFADEALVHHRCLPRTFRQHLRAQRQVIGFPGLARRSPVVGRWLTAGFVLSRRSAAFDGAVVSALAAAVTRKPALLAGVLPWAWMAAREASERARGDKSEVPWIFVGLGVGDLVACVSLVQGSVRYRRLVI